MLTAGSKLFFFFETTNLLPPSNAEKITISRKPWRFDPAKATRRDQMKENNTPGWHLLSVYLPVYFNIFKPVENGITCTARVPPLKRRSSFRRGRFHFPQTIAPHFLYQKKPRRRNVYHEHSTRRWRDFYQSKKTFLTKTFSVPANLSHENRDDNQNGCRFSNFLHSGVWSSRKRNDDLRGCETIHKEIISLQNLTIQLTHNLEIQTESTRRQYDHFQASANTYLSYAFPINHADRLKKKIHCLYRL